MSCEELLLAYPDLPASPEWAGVRRALETILAYPSRCCGGVLYSGEVPSHACFHGKHWACSYPETVGEEEAQVGVEMGVSLYPASGSERGQACTHWIFDTDSVSESFEYGEAIPLPDSDAPEEEWEAWWSRLDAQLDKAAEAAFNADVLSCPECGNHYVDARCSCKELTFLERLSECGEEG